MMDTREEVAPMAREEQREAAFKQERKAFRLAGFWAVIATLAWGSGFGLQFLLAADPRKLVPWLNVLALVIAIAAFGVCLALASWLTAIRRLRRIEAQQFRPNDR